MTKEETCLKLEEITRRYYNTYPFGHSIIDAHKQYKEGVAAWEEVCRVSSELEDDHEYLKTIQQTLKEEGILKNVYE